MAEQKEKSIHAGHRERIRERARREGLAAFSEHEVLELLLTYTIPQKDVNPLAHALIDRFGSVSNVFGADENELMQVNGVGRNAALLLSLMPQLMRYYQMNAQGDKPVISNLAQAKQYCAPLFLGARQERLYMVCLNKNGQVRYMTLLHTGTVDEVALYPRVVVQTALRHDAHAVLLAHNHPSGMIEPSMADTKATLAVTRALETMNIAMVDHLIFAGGETYSMTRRMLLSEPGAEDFSYMTSSGGTSLRETQDRKWITMDLSHYGQE